MRIGVYWVCPRCLQTIGTPRELWAHLDAVHGIYFSQNGIGWKKRKVKS